MLSILDIRSGWVYLDQHGESIAVTSIDGEGTASVTNYDRVRWATYASDVPRRTGETTRVRFAGRMRMVIGPVNVVDP